MAHPVSWTLELSVSASDLDAFRELMHEMVASTRNEPGALAYSWFHRDGEVHIYERYADSEATLQHLGNFGQHFMDRFLALARPTRFSVYGEPNDTVREALAGFGAVHYATFGGFVR